MFPHAETYERQPGSSCRLRKQANGSRARAAACGNNSTAAGDVLPHGERTVGAACLTRRYGLTFVNAGRGYIPHKFSFNPFAAKRDMLYLNYLLFRPRFDSFHFYCSPSKFCLLEELAIALNLLMTMLV
ncbi:MAG: hypothetical protein KDJ65_26760 [Anaerolineae bacterium]|nr:hypothetical protein [Anaerolineae bacterium]